MGALLLLAPSVAAVDAGVDRSAEVEPTGPAPGADADASARAGDEAPVRAGADADAVSLPNGEEAGAGANARYDAAANRWKAGAYGAGNGVYTVRHVDGSIAVYREANDCDGLQRAASEDCNGADERVLVQSTPGPGVIPSPEVPRTPDAPNPDPSQAPNPGDEVPGGVPSGPPGAPSVPPGAPGPGVPGVPDEGPSDPSPGFLTGLVEEVLGQLPSQTPNPADLVPDLSSLPGADDLPDPEGILGALPGLDDLTNQIPNPDPTELLGLLPDINNLPGLDDLPIPDLGDPPSPDAGDLPVPGPDDLPIPGAP